MQDLALAVYSVGDALHIAFLSISWVASILMGLGIASSFGEMSVLKAAANGLVLVGVLLLLISSSSLTMGLACYFVIGNHTFPGPSGVAAGRRLGEE